MHVELVVPRVEIDEGEGHEPVVRPLIKLDQQAPIPGVVQVVPVGGREKLRRHPLHLRREDILGPVVERLRMIALSSEPERRSQTDFGQEVVPLCN